MDSELVIERFCGVDLIGWNDLEMIWEPWKEDLFSRKDCFEAEEREEVKVVAMVAIGYVLWWWWS